MKRPERFFDLPTQVQEDLLWDMELDFDHYDSSQVGCIHDILNRNISDANQCIITTAYKFLSDESLESRIKVICSHAKITAAFCEEILNGS
jgi:hypothetical protein